MGGGVCGGFFLAFQNVNRLAQRGHLGANGISAVRAEQCADLFLCLEPGAVDLNHLCLAQLCQHWKNLSAFAILPAYKAGSFQRFEVSGQRGSVYAEKTGDLYRRTCRPVGYGSQKLGLGQFKAKRCHVPIIMSGQKIGGAPGSVTEAGSAHVLEIDIFKRREHLL